MPLVNVEGVGLIDFPEGMSGEQIDAAVRKDILPQYPDIAAKTKRGWGEALTDVGASAIKGVGALAQLPGQIGQLAGVVAPTETNTGLQGIGKQIEQFGEEAKSPILKGKEVVRGQKIEQADGMLSEFGTAFKETIKDPALLSSFFAEQLPNLAGSWGGGLLAKGTAKALMMATTEQALAKVGVAGAVGTGAIQQGADVGSDTYETIYKRLIKEGMGDEQANGIALSKARVAALEAAGLSLGTAALPGGTAIERALVGKGLPGAGGFTKGLLGETASETIEEGGGKLASNLGVQEVFPETSLTKGVGAAAGMGALGGALFGGVAGYVNADRATPEQKQIVADGIDTVQQLEDQARRDAFEAEQKAIELRALEERHGFTNSAAYAELSAEVERLKAKAQLAFAKADKGKAEMSAFAEAQPDLFGMVTAEKQTQEAEVQPPVEQPNQLSLPLEDQQSLALNAPPQPLNLNLPAQTQAPVVQGRPITLEDIKGMGIGGGPNVKIKQAILGKDLTDPKQAAEVKAALEEYAGGDRSASIIAKVERFLNSAPFLEQQKLSLRRPYGSMKKPGVETPTEEEQALYQAELEALQTSEEQNAGKPIEPLNGGNEPSVRVPSKRPAIPTATKKPKRRGVVPPVDTTGQPIGAEVPVERTLGAKPLTLEEKAAQAIAQRQAPKGGYNPDIQEPSVELSTRHAREYKEAIGNYLENANYIGAKALDALAGDMHAGDNLTDAKRAYRGLSEEQKAYVAEKTKELEKYTRRGDAYAKQQNEEVARRKAFQGELDEQEKSPKLERILPGSTNEELTQAVQRGDLNAALNAIAKDKSDTFNILEKLVSNRLLANKGSLPKIEVVPAGTIKDGAAQYNPFTDTVQINEGEVDSHTVLHETVHGFLHALIQKFEAGAKNKGIADLKTLYDFIKENHPNVAEEYGMSSLTEFASELMSNRQFQETLAQIPYRAEAQNLFSAFIRAVLNALGLSPTSKLSALASGLFAADRSLAIGRKIQEDVVTGKETLPTAKVTRDLEAIYKATGPKTVKPATTPIQSVQNTKKEIKNLASSFETMYLSSDAALNNAIRKGLEANGKDWDTTKNAMLEISTSQATHADAVADQFLREGNVEYDPKLHKWEVKSAKDSWAKLITKNLADIAKKYGITQDQANNYANQALVASRLDGLSKSDKEIYSHMTPEQIKAGLSFFEAIPELKAVRDSWNAIRKNVMKVAIEGGLYNEQQAEELLKIMDYVPFFRIEQLEQNAGPSERGGRGLLNFAKNYKIKGSEQEVNDIFDNMGRWTSYTVSRAVKNRSALSLKNAAIQFLPEGEVKELRIDESTKKEQHVIDIWENGQRRKYEFSDPLFIHAFQGIDGIAIPHFGMAQAASNILRKTIVMVPIFSISQLSQDSFGAMLTSGLKHPWALPLEVVKEFTKTLFNKSKTHKELTAIGAVGTKDYSATTGLLGATRRETIEREAGLKKTPIWSRLYNSLEKFSMTSDNAVRQAVYNLTMKETGDKALATEKAFELINFKRTGASAKVQLLRQVIPFFGAYLQAQNVIYKTLAGKGISPVQRKEAHRILASNALKIGALAFMYAALASDDEEYQKMDPAIRDRHLLIPGTNFMLPMRSDLTLMPKLIAEYTYLGMTDNGFTDGKKIRRAMTDALVNAVLSPTVAPQAIKPALEVLVNYDFFTDRPIIGQGIEHKITAEQYTNSTSEFGKFIGSSGLIAPVNVDHLVKGYMGTVGGLGLMFTNAVVNAGSDQPKPEKSLQDTVSSVPGLSAFFAKEYGNADKNDFYELRKDVDKAVTTFNSMKKQGRVAEAKEFLEEGTLNPLNPFSPNVKDLLKVNKQVDNINNQLTKLRDYEKKIYDLPESRMSAEKKGEEIRRVREMEKVYLSNVHKLRQMAGY